MNIVADNLGKIFTQQWIFRNFSYQFEQGKSYAITGHNGSGKSTLLKTLAGVQPVSEGKLSYWHAQKSIEESQYFRHLSFVAPYTELIEEFSMAEMIAFHHRLKPLSLAPEAVMEKIGFSTAQKPIRLFSSGMKQKLKLALALYEASEILLLDEPTSNLDTQNARWYAEEIQNVLPQKLVIIASNVPTEYEFCENVLSMEKNVKMY